MLLNLRGMPVRKDARETGILGVFLCFLAIYNKPATTFLPVMASMGHGVVNPDNGRSNNKNGKANAYNWQAGQPEARSVLIKGGWGRIIGAASRKWTCQSVGWQEASIPL